MNHSDLNNLLELYDNIYNDLYFNNLHSIAYDVNLIDIRNVDYVNNISFIINIKGYTRLGDIENIKAYINVICHLYNYWTYEHNHNGYSMDIQNDYIKNVIEYIKDTKQDLLDSLKKEARLIIEEIKLEDKYNRK